MLAMIPVTRAHAVEDDEIAQVENRLGQVQEAGLRLDMQNGVVNTTSWVTLTQFSLWAGVQRVAGLPQDPAADPRRRGADERIFQHADGRAGGFPQHAAHDLARVRERQKSSARCSNAPTWRKTAASASWRTCAAGSNSRAVRFAYPGNGGEGEKEDDTAALVDFSLRVEPGETLGIVGASGSGKSTLMGLLLGFHRPVDGSILLDGEDMNRIDLRSLPAAAGGGQPGDDPL